MAGERIVTIGPAKNVRVPPDASVINGAGSFLIPGLCDMHVHFAIPAVDSGFEASNRVYALQLLANGITTVRNMRGFAELLEFRRRTMSGDILGPEIYTTGPGNNSTLDITPYDRKLDTAAQAIRAVQLDKAAGFDAIKVYGGLSAIPYRALMAEARRVSMPVYGHVPYAVGLTEVLEQRQASIEHLTGYLEAINEPDSTRILKTKALPALCTNIARLGYMMWVRPRGSLAFGIVRRWFFWLPLANAARGSGSLTSLCRQPVKTGLPSLTSRTL